MNSLQVDSQVCFTQIEDSPGTQRVHTQQTGSFRGGDAVKSLNYEHLREALTLFSLHRLDGLIDSLIHSDYSAFILHFYFAIFVLTMELCFSRQTGFPLTVFTFLIFLHGSRGEIPPSASVTIVPPVKPDNGPQAFPNDEKANLPVFTMDYPRIQIPFEITLWMLLASFAKIGEEPKLVLLLTQNLL